MDQNIINITHHEGRGHMTVVLDKFFPTDVTRLRKLLKVIDEDYEHRDELQPKIDKLTRQVSAMQEYINTYCKRGKGQGYRQQLKELKAQLKDAKEQQRRALSLYRDYQRQFVSAEKNAERLKKNAEVADYGK